MYHRSYKYNTKAFVSINSYLFCLVVSLTATQLMKQRIIFILYSYRTTLQLHITITATTFYLKFNYAGRIFNTLKTYA